jgi:nucleotide-binding universal stress UspA family protein
MNEPDPQHHDHGARIVVGVDGSPQAVDAALWAAALAERRGAAVHLLHAFPPGPKSLLGRSHRGEYTRRRTEDGEALLDTVRHEILARHPRVWITGEVAEGDPARLLVALSYHASLVSVATRGCGGFDELLLGSVCLRLAAHCHCPSVFVPGCPESAHPAADGEVVLGVKHDEPAAVVDFAFRAAADLGTGVRAVHAFDSAPLDDGFYLVDPAVLEKDARILLDDVLKRAPANRFPNVAATSAAIRGCAAGALIGAAGAAPLLVIGASRARSPVSVGVGAVAHALLLHATCPVAIVPGATLRPVGS